MKHTTPTNPADMKNMIIAAVICTGLLFVWQVMYVNPREQARQFAVAEQAQLQQKAIRTEEGDVILPTTPDGAAAEDITNISRDAAVSDSPRVTLTGSNALHGSINLRGLRFDDLTLVRHRVSVDEESPEVVLLTPAQHEQRYFLQMGWLPAASGSGMKLPDGSSLWTASSNELSPGNPVTLSWNNGQGVDFRVEVSLDENYLFTLKQQVVNNSATPLDVMPYGLINRAVPQGDRFSTILHTGPIGVFNEELTEVSYGDLAEEDEKITYKDTAGWLGMADKYWLTAFIPPKGEQFDATFQHVSPRGHDRTQVDFLGKAIRVPAGGTADYTVHTFAGAKELEVLETYRESLDLPLFDRALDFGILYFLTKPIFLSLDFFYGILGNFGLAILAFVVVLKVLLFPLSNKSYKSMAQMRVLQPQIDEVRKKYDHDRVRMQQEVMAVWQRERVNPVSGCLPMLIQIPIFFALYKVLLVTIEMRHAPFYGWIDDLSSPDPTNVFTLFGLLPWNVPGILHIGIWPIIMAATMVLQQKLNPKPTDPMQAKVIGWLPYIFLVLFASFPAGLLIYWAWNNLLSVLQQLVITRRIEAAEKKKGKPKAKAALAEKAGG